MQKSILFIEKSEGQQNNPIQSSSFCRGQTLENDKNMCLAILYRKHIRNNDRKLSEKQAKHMPSTSLKLPPNTRKLFINHPVQAV